MAEVVMYCKCNQVPGVIVIIDSDRVEFVSIRGIHRLFGFGENFIPCNPFCDFFFFLSDISSDLFAMAFAQIL